MTVASWPQAGVLAVACASWACGGQPGPPADLVLLDAAVYTMDSTRPRAEAVAVRDGRIVFVGAGDSARAWVGAETRVLDLSGRMVLPGFHDTHVHPVTGGIELGECDLNGAGTRAEVVRLVAACARRDPEASWLRGGGWQAPLFPGGNAPRALLDSLVPDHPAYLTSADAHSAWVNTRAFAIAGVTRDTPDPPNGRIEREPGGAPGGTLRESAMELVARHLPDYTDAEYLAGLRRGLALAARFGITTLHEARADEPILRAYHRAESLGVLTARVMVAIHADAQRPPSAEARRLATLRARYAGPLVHPLAAKIVLDGVIEGQTAALLDPYLDRPGYRGELNVAPDTLARLVHALDSAGFVAHVHAIGDRAIRVALDALEPVATRADGGGPRPVLAHVQLWDPADLPRPARLGVALSFQPLWAYADSYIRDLTEPRLGNERSRWLYPIASVLATGAVVAGGSDWSVTSMNPLDAVQVAVTRRALADSTGPPWIPEERVDLAAILRAYTVGGAVAGGLAGTTGTIAVGKAADLVVLERDLFGVPPHAIHRVPVVLTLLEGREVYRR
ncbi:MAG: amidohydrolase [Gemmatimonadales bacterium]